MEIPQMKSFHISKAFFFGMNVSRLTISSGYPVAESSRAAFGATLLWQPIPGNLAVKHTS